MRRSRILLMLPSIVYYWFFVLLIPTAISGYIFVPNKSESFHVTHTRLHAWSLPDPSTMAASFTGSMWYNEYNPTYRRTVYEDDRINYYDFVALGDDWPSPFVTNDNSSADATQLIERSKQRNQQRIINPLRMMIRRLRRNRQVG